MFLKTLTVLCWLDNIYDTVSFISGESGSSANTENNLPTIPIQTISCQFAGKLIGNMTGYIAPVLWRGGISGMRYSIEDEGTGNKYFFAVESSYLFKLTLN